MPSFSGWLSGSAVLMTLAMTAGAFAPLVISAPASAQISPGVTENTTQPTFYDVSNHWASPFIQALAARNIITGYPDGSFRPSRLVNRANFAAMLQKAFPSQKVQHSSLGSFVDVPANYWAASAIKNAYQSGFMTGYPGRLFHPNKDISKVQAIVALARGLGLSFTGYPKMVLNRYYTDAKTIPNYAVKAVAAATQAHIIVNYPNVKVLAPNGVISRGEAAALIYQALVAQGVLPPITDNTKDANYIVANRFHSLKLLLPVASAVPVGYRFWHSTSGLHDS